ncbi:twin-arginine translocation signal domain-containing protein [Acidovorax sp. M14]|uniref:twin-arginine translocation signal domain-containing protein n=1 Tax=Acidovorax sp. M14 TaxID=3411354 RepID=UPI003BF604BB
MKGTISRRGLLGHTSCACVALGIPATTPRHSSADRASSMRRRGREDADRTWLCWMRNGWGFMFVSFVLCFGVVLSRGERLQLARASPIRGSRRTGVQTPRRPRNP